MIIFPSSLPSCPFSSFILHLTIEGQQPSLMLQCMHSRVEVGGESRGKERGSSLILCHGKTLRCCFRQRARTSATRTAGTSKKTQEQLCEWDRKQRYVYFILPECLRWYKHWCSGQITWQDFTAVLKWSTGVKWTTESSRMTGPRQLL